MQSSGYIKLQCKVDVDEFFSAGFEDGKVGSDKGKKKQMAMGIEMKNKGIVRVMLYKSETAALNN